MRTACLLVADELHYSLNGKMHVFGIYTGDIGINADPTFVNQIVFLFIIEASPDDPFRKLELYIELPQGEKRIMQLPVPEFRPTKGDERRWSLRYPILIQNAFLRPGQIEAKVIHESGEIPVSAPYIALPRPTLDSSQMS